MIERFASGTWLTPSLMCFAAIAMIAGTIGSLGLLVATADGTLDLLGRPLGTDFSSFFTAGRMALAGRAAEAYDWAAHLEFQRQFHGASSPFPWSYPPVFLVLAAALATLPYVPALAVWQGTTLLAAVGVYARIMPGRRALLIGLGFPGILVCLGHGQTGFLSAALFAGGLLALPRREILAGVLFGLLAYKPQLGLLLPIALVAGGYWRAIAAAAATVLLSVAVTLAIWGWPVWQAFLDSLPLTRTVVLEAGNTGFEKFQSAFAWVRLWDGPLVLAYGLQALVTGCVLTGCIWIWRGNADYRLKCAALLSGALLSTPYVLDYDFVIFGMALAMLVAHGLERGFRRWEQTLLALAWFAPAAARGIAKAIYLPLGFFMLVAIFILIVVHVRSERAAGTLPHERLAAA
jgi:alpha-1,2-mannosyltransferase